MKRGLMSVISLVIVLFSISFVVADFELGNQSESILNEYGPGATLSGWINLSLDDEPSDSELSAFGSSMKLLDFLKANNVDSNG